MQLRLLLHLSTEDLRFADSLVRGRGEAMTLWMGSAEKKVTSDKGFRETVFLINACHCGNLNGFVQTRQAFLRHSRKVSLVCEYYKVI